jgi:Rrf2 family iron-sulfur cluster assembly transcriptional regulator
VGLQLTRGSEYGIRAMMFLARREPGEVCALRDVSSAQDVPESFLAKIFQSLVHAGLVTSYRGARGGFALAAPADEITVAMVIEAIDGPISLNHCVVWPESCQNSADCPLHALWVRAQEAMLDVLGEVTFDQLVAERKAALA